MNDIASMRKMRLQSGFGNTTGFRGTTELDCAVSVGSDGFFFEGKT